MVMWKKCKSYTWKADLKYWLIYLPIETVKALLGIARKEHIYNNMTKRQCLDLAKGLADCRSGRLLEWIDKTEEGYDNE